MVSAIRETKVDLVKLVGKIDGMESGWDRIAERSRMSSPIHHPRLTTYVHMGPFDFSTIGFKVEFVETAIDGSR